jgi:hypothetical protein
VKAEPLAAVTLAYVQPGDRVIIPIEADVSDSELHDIALALKDRHPGVDFTLLTSTQMTHAIVYRPTPVPRELCAATWHQRNAEHENHRCAKERGRDHGNKHRCRCGAEAVAFMDEDCGSTTRICIRPDGLCRVHDELAAP